MTNIEEIKKAYQEISKKHKLPSFDPLNDNFELSLIDLEKGELLNSILRRIIDTMNTNLDNVYPAVNPNQNSIYSMQLYSKLSEKEREQITKFYMEIISFQLEAVNTFLEGDKLKAEFVNKMAKVYPEMKKNIKQYINLFSSTWEKIRKEFNQKEKNTGFTG